MKLRENVLSYLVAKNSVIIYRGGYTTTLKEEGQDDNERCFFYQLFTNLYDELFPVTISILVLSLKHFARKFSKRQTA